MYNNKASLQPNILFHTLNYVLTPYINQILFIMNYLWILLAISFVTSAVGWIYFIYFFSIGYGLTISVLTTATALIFHDVLNLPTAILCGVLIIYGIRLAGYLFLRERKSDSYNKILYQPDNTKQKPLISMLMIWISCALLYIGQISPVTFYLYNLKSGVSVSNSWVWIGTIITTLGVIIEIVADLQKSKAKRRSPNRFVDTGLYRLVRCPNYFGEILMWTGMYIICFGSCCTWSQWLIATLGYIGIIYVMFSGARRIELRQQKIYGQMPQFQTYIHNRPLIIPFIPIYSVAKHTWLKA